MNSSDLEDIGLDELLYDRAVFAIEWAEKMSGDLPAGHLAMTFEITADDYRKISLIAYGHSPVNLVKALELEINVSWGLNELNRTEIRWNFSSGYRTYPPCGQAGKRNL
jgi:hypothetical protein